MHVASYQAPNFVGSHPAIMKHCVLASSGAEVDLVAGTVLGLVTATGKAVPWNPAAADGSEVAAVILVEDVRVPSAGDISANVYVHGEFRGKGLGWPDAATAEQKAAAVTALATKGLYVK
ncbi:head decoration protein [Desulfovibrio ferrophilus]|uniref:Head decoration protein n=1 Tax=Desulfovibrio ferrophilus TaxID=241368 RepID=A0A2Z6AYW5_9BACT|nr:head decoration protein [Desulfovibrio ferrophilus]BBD08461.1 uncharacterized protein DFE_1735 [Desulfovibrio ferrophilus]